jgi:hypothetical protein
LILILLYAWQELKNSTMAETFIWRMERSNFSRLLNHLVHKWLEECWGKSADRTLQIYSSTAPVVVYCSFYFCWIPRDVSLDNLNVKEPGGHWTINLNALPNSPPPGTFVVGAGGNLAPQLVLEVAVSNETMPTLTQTDLARYFAAGTGTRWWVGIEVFKDPDGTNRWWAGHASRRIVNGQFQNVADISPESMSTVQTNNVDLNIPTSLWFHIQVSTLIHPCAAPANYPATLDIDLENIRQLIVSLLWYGSCNLLGCLLVESVLVVCFSWSRLLAFRFVLYHLLLNVRSEEVRMDFS